MSYAVWAEVPIKSEHFEAACEAVADIVVETRGEAGCHRFEPYRAADGSPTVLIHERWNDRAAFDFHHAQDYTRAVYRKYEDWLSGPVRIRELSDLSER
ncbi:MAG: hypothetical protein AVDCRST_MAG91-1600 [uncultured Sphingomonadaceae bacterium]|uniref:ABM domain-containing protein n=1 Tax=uncultured Sphingomonadaceae bacterium TaxID=169976 RepID=A0A6J4T077_9SPHN|nr:MAG: hypothetical protein AVDCRST_MAG91-1600 [uncultured Sphingomonadaceae bacterium]